MPQEAISDRYELLEELSHGGMGDVWRGYDAVLDRPVAVKLVRQASVTSPQLAEEFAKRFRREARITARIQHPGVPQVYDAVSAHHFADWTSRVGYRTRRRPEGASHWSARLLDGSSAVFRAGFPGQACGLRGRWVPRAALPDSSQIPLVGRQPQEPPLPLLPHQTGRDERGDPVPAGGSA